MISNFFKIISIKYKSLPTSKKLIFGGLFFILVLFLLLGGNRTVLSSYVVTAKDITETVVATGEVTSQVDLSLGFEKSGMVNDIKVSLGDNVKKGDVLVKLSLSKDEAELTKARGALLKAQAQYNNALGVTGDQNIRLLELQLDNAKKEQDQLVENAYRTLLSGDLEAIPVGEDEVGTAPTVTGQYSCDEEGQYTIDLYSSSAASGSSFAVSGLESGTGTVIPDSTDNIGECGLYISFSSDFIPNTTWVVDVPNTRSSNYSANLNAYNLALTTRDNTISELEKELEIEKESVVSGDVAVAYANLVSAEGEYDSAKAIVDQGIIYAPEDGVVTKIDVSPGDLVQAYESVITVQDITNLYVKANINEANIATVSKGQDVIVTFDAFGPEDKIMGKIESVDVAPSKLDGVVNYEIAVSMNSDDRIKPGMTSTVYVVTGKKEGVAAIPTNAIVFENGESQVLVSENGKKKKVVLIGLRGDNGDVEITSGISIGDTIYLP